MAGREEQRNRLLADDLSEDRRYDNPHTTINAASLAYGCNSPTINIQDHAQVFINAGDRVLWLKTACKDHKTKIYIASAAVGIGFAIGLLVYFLIPIECDVLHDFSHGSVNCTEDPYNTSVDAICSFTCNERYQIKGNNDNATCLENSTWTTLPSCELITCPSMEIIQWGSSTCTDGNKVDSKCTFSCDEGHDQFGPSEAVCRRNGEWSTSEPVKCILRACPRLQQIPYGNLACSNATYKVGTSCKPICLQNHVMSTNGSDLSRNDSTIQCQENQQWSDDLPSCVCPPCNTGEQCEWTTSWNVFKSSIHSETDSELNYDGNQITSEPKKYWHKFQLEWKCNCVDVRTGHAVECRDQNPKYSCEYACSRLIREMVSLDKYEIPCDSSSMPTICWGL